MWWGKSIYIYLSLHCHHQNDSCIRWAAMRVILMFHCEDKVTRQCPQTTAVFEEKGEPKRNRAAALLLRLTARPNRLSLSLSGSLSPKLVKAGYRSEAPFVSGVTTRLSKRQ